MSVKAVELSLKEQKMVTKEVRCACASAVCGHNGEKCNKPVKVTVKASYSLDASKESPERNTGICEECFNTARKAFPHIFA